MFWLGEIGYSWWWNLCLAQAGPQDCTEEWQERHQEHQGWQWKVPAMPRPLWYLLPERQGSDRTAIEGQIRILFFIKNVIIFLIHANNYFY